MKVTTRELVLSVINQKIAEIQKNRQQMIEDRNNSESAMTSRYDTKREELDTAIQNQDEMLKNIKLLQQSVEKYNAKMIIEEGAELQLQINQTNEVIQAICLPVTINIPGFQVLTSQSPLGKSLQGKKLGERFFYQVGENTVSGTISKVG